MPTKNIERALALSNPVLWGVVFLVVLLVVAAIAGLIMFGLYVWVRNELAKPEPTNEHPECTQCGISLGREVCQVCATVKTNDWPAVEPVHEPRVQLDECGRAEVIANEPEGEQEIFMVTERKPQRPRRTRKQTRVEA